MTEPLLLLPLDVPRARLVRPADDTLHHAAGAAMGTSWSLRALGKTDAATLTALVEAEIAAVTREMSQWETDSALSRFNRAEAGSWHHLPQGFFDVMTAALALARRTDGAFDPTLGELTELWGFGASQPATIPPAPADIASALAHGGWSKLELDASNHSLRQPGGLKLDLSGIAKGHSVDRVARALTRAGVVSFLIEVGGELVARGLKPDGEPWWIDLDQPPGAQLAPVRIGLMDTAIATSGDYRRYHQTTSGKLSHTLDPRTGQPLVDPPASVTVLHADCMMADALATAIAVLGADTGLALANDLDVAAIIVSRRDGVWACDLSARARVMSQ